MHKRKEFAGLSLTLSVALLGILPLPKIVAAFSPPQRLSPAALRELTPEGYKLEKTTACGLDQRPQEECLVALSDADNSGIASKPVMLLLVEVGKRIVAEDRVTPHNTAKTGQFWDGPPNYFDGVTKERVGNADMFLVKSVLTGGGSGSLHFFDFYRVENNRLRLVKSFSHERMERTYFAVFKNATYDAEKVCTRGEKRGPAYVYTCYLQVTKYTFDGHTFSPVGSERMREQRGNRFLTDKYWFISVLKALQQNEIFKQTP